jgi:sec-independent protein translocase protein TatC
MSNGIIRDPDDFFAETRMSFGDHIEDLRGHLWRAIGGLFFCLAIGFVLDGIGYLTDWPLYPGAKTHQLRASTWVAWIKGDSVTPGDRLPFGIGVPLMKVIQDPVEEALTNFYDKQQNKALEQAGEKGTKAYIANEPVQIELVFPREPLERLGMKVPKDVQEVALPAKTRPLEFLKQTRMAQEVLRPRTLTTLSVQEALVVYFKVSLVAGLVIGSPWVFWQIWSFVAAGLYPHEKRLVHVYLPLSLGLFLGGVLLCQFLVMPQAVAAMLWFNEWLGMSPDLRLNEWLSFAIWMPVVFGISFQTPLVMLFMGKLGIVDIDWFKGKRRYAWFFMAVFAAVITPSPDAVSMLLLTIPMCLLYELGIFMIKMSPRPELSEEPAETDELIEV